MNDNENRPCYDPVVLIEHFQCHTPKKHAIQGIRTFQKAVKQVPVPPGAFFTIQLLAIHFSFVWGQGMKSTFPTRLE
jgi:hypothetical protein